MSELMLRCSTRNIYGARMVEVEFELLDFFEHFRRPALSNRQARLISHATFEPSCFLDPSSQSLNSLGSLSRNVKTVNMMKAIVIEKWLNVCC